MEEKDIERLLEKFDASSLQEFEMTQGDLHLAFSKRAQAATVVQESVPVVSDAAPAPAAPASTSTSTSAQPAAVPAPHQAPRRPRPLPPRWGGGI
ncbi:hypothetical protein [Schleiferilactobacillus harbinensis]|uniref:hypothetical protein n=1 Tax=Schleiferilactobacillus harbinensis TaxID=304207 RepID=UPI0039EA746F